MALVFALLLEPASPEIAFRMEAKESAAHWQSYRRMLMAANDDREQTLDFQLLGFYERNPILGRHPSELMINLYFAADLLIPAILSPLPDWVKSSIADTIALNEEMMVRANDEVFLGRNRNPGWPICLVITVHTDWDRVFAWGRE